MINIQPNAQNVTVQTPHGVESILYDQLIYALGSTVDMHSVDGVADHAFSLADLKSSQQIGDALPKLASREGDLLIVGSGLTGIEAATEIAETYPAINVHLVTRGQFGDDLSNRGTSIYEKTSVSLASI